MASRPLHSASVVDGYERQLRAAGVQAFSAQVGTLNTKLRSHGVTAVLTAASLVKNKSKRNAHAAAIGAVSIPFLWSQEQWAKYVNEYIEPVAVAVATAAVVSAAALVFAGAASNNGAAFSQAEAIQDIVARIVGLAMGSGQAIGERVDAAGIADDDIVKGVQAVVDGGTDILGNLLGSLGQFASNQSGVSLGMAVTAANAPTYLSATKTWNTQEDDRVRPDHEDVDGTDVPLNAQFTVGGEPMDGPGDPSASDEQTINCRCWLSYDGLVPDDAGITQEIPPDPEQNMEGS